MEEQPNSVELSPRNDPMGEETMHASKYRASAALGLFVAIPLSVVGCAIAPAGEPEPIDVTASAQVTTDTAMAAEIVLLTNAERQNRGLPPLQVDLCLEYAAQAHAANMAKSGNLTHDLFGLGASERIERTGYQGWTRNAENLDNWWGTNDIGAAYPARAVQGWLSSPPHRGSLLGPNYTHIGVGVARIERNGGFDYYAVQNFGTGGTCQLDFAGYQSLLR
jgi:uncharacterized protein YkwD